MKRSRLNVRIALLALAICFPLSRTSAQTPATWGIAPTPLFVVGGSDAPSETFTRIGGAVRLRDGRFVVADERDLRVSVYDTRGKQLIRFGRNGSGPGEFRSLGGIWLAGGDTIVSWDSRLRRLTRFLPDGTVAGTHVVQLQGDASPAEGRLDAFMGGFPDGRVVLAWIAADRSQEDRLAADRMTFGVFSPRGEFSASSVRIREWCAPWSLKAAARLFSRPSRMPACQAITSHTRMAPKAKCFSSMLVVRLEPRRAG